MGGKEMALIAEIDDPSTHSGAGPEV